MKYFKYKEFDCPPDKNGDNIGSGKKYMDKTFLSFLDTLRERCNFPFKINSGFRTSEYQKDLTRRGYKTAKGISPHEEGIAADIHIADSKKRALFIGFAIELTHELGLPIRLGIAGKNAGNFIHIDISEKRNSPSVWVY